MAEEEIEPSHTKMRAYVAVAVVAIVVIAAFYMLTANPDNGGNGIPPPEGVPIELTTMTATWEELDLHNQAPAEDSLFLWVQVKVKNIDDMPFDIVSYEFAAEGTDGSKFNATDDDSTGSIDPGELEIFNMSIEVPLTWTPKKMVYNSSGEEVTSTISTPAPLIHDIAFTSVTHVINSTDYANLNHSSEKVLHVSFSMKNQWTAGVLTQGIYFTATTAGGGSYSIHYKSGPDTLATGASGSFDLEFLVPLISSSWTIRFEMPNGPYGSISI